MVAEDAVYCAVGGRGSAVLEIHFAAFRDVPSVTDEYAAYKRLEDRQSDWSHILRKAEKWGIYGDWSDFILYLRLLGMPQAESAGRPPVPPVPHGRAGLAAGGASRHAWARRRVLPRNHRGACSRRSRGRAPGLSAHHAFRHGCPPADRRESD